MKARPVAPDWVLGCEVCGRLPHPGRLRLTLVKLAAVFPVEFLLHALVVRLHPPYPVTVAVLAVTTTVLVIWVVEPSAMRLLNTWLHARVTRARGRIEAAEALWRIRVTVRDEPGALETLAHQLGRLEVNILGMQVHPLDEAARDELIVATSARVDADDLLEAAAAGGGVDAHVWPTSAADLVDGQAAALALAARVTARPEDLPAVAAELLGARVVGDWRAGSSVDASDVAGHGVGRTTLRIPSPWGAVALFRPEEPFTPAESARAHRLAEIAETAGITAWAAARRAGGSHAA